MPSPLPPATAEALRSKLRGYLLLSKAENVTPHCLAILGLRPRDFCPPDGATHWVHWEPDALYVQAKVFPDDHPSIANVMGHEDLIGYEPEEDGTAIYTFQWPRHIEANRPEIQDVFPETQADPLWKTFVRGWADITPLFPPVEPSIASLKGDDDEPATTMLADASGTLEGNQAPLLGDFDDGMDLGSEEITDPGETVLVIQTAAEEGSALEVVHGAGDPAIEAAAQAVLDAQSAEKKRGRGRPKGSTKAAKEAQQDAGLGDVQTEITPEGKTVIPACVKFADILEEELNRLRSVGDLIRAAEDFPIEAIRSLKNSLDRLALRSAHMEFRGQHDTDDPRAINPLVEITLANISAAASAAVRDLGLAPERPKAWEDFSKAVKETVDLAKSMLDIVSQMGAGPAIQEPPRLKTEDGKTLVV